MDQTRKQAKLEFADTPARLIGTEGEGWDVLGKVLDLVAVGLAAEQVGGAQKVLDMAVEYAKVRVQFGRPIGSFQAIKHKCADMLLEVESAKSAAYYGMWCASEMNDELPSRRLAGQGLLLGGVLPRRRREHPDPRRHRLHVGAPGAPVLQAGQELRAAVRRPDVPPRAAGPAHRHLTPYVPSCRISSAICAHRKVSASSTSIPDSRELMSVIGSRRSRSIGRPGQL